MGGVVGQEEEVVEERKKEQEATALDAALAEMFLSPLLLLHWNLQPILTTLGLQR